MTLQLFNGGCLFYLFMDEYLKITITELNEVLTPTAPKKAGGTQKSTFVLKRKIQSKEFVASLFISRIKS